jgi:hypothetical protein
MSLKIIGPNDTTVNIDEIAVFSVDIDNNPNPRNLCFAPEPCPIIAATDYLETPGPSDDRNIVLNGEEFTTKVQIPNWVAGLPGEENTFVEVILKGVPIDIEKLGTADTIVKRLDTVAGLQTIEDLPDNKVPIPAIDAEPTPDNITRLEIVGLSLKSVEPLETDNGPHDMYVGLQSYLRPDDEDSVSKGTMAIHYSSADSFMKGKWSSIFIIKAVCVLVPAGSCSQFESTQNEDGTWNPPLRKPLDPDTGLADPKGLVHRLVKDSIDSGYDYEQSPESVVNKQSIKILEDNVESVPEGDAVKLPPKKMLGENLVWKKDPEAPQIEPDNKGAKAFSLDYQGNSEPAATGNMSIDNEVIAPHDSGCKDEECTDRVTHGVAGQPIRVMCEGEDCGNLRSSMALAKQAVILPDNVVYTKDILLDFNKKQVEYLLVGSAARSKNYKDIDLLYKNTDENINKIIQVLHKHNVVPVDIDHTIVVSKDVNLDIFSNIPYQKNISYENFENTTIVNILGVDCPAINKEDAKNLLRLDTRRKSGYRVLKKQNLKSLSVDNYTYSWEVSTDNGDNWTRMGQTKNSISVHGRIEKNNNLYRVVVESDNGDAVKVLDITRDGKIKLSYKAAKADEKE